MPEIYDQGDLLRVSASFTTGGTAVDPSTVTFRTKSIEGTAAYLYGTDSEVVKDAIGEYHADIPLDETGPWWLRVESTGTGQAAEETKIKVQSSF